MISRRSHAAFTLLELLVVIAIIGILAALLAPSIPGLLRGHTTGTATRQMLDEIGRARQLAISQRTTVYMVFVPTNFWQDSAVTAWTVHDRRAATNLADKQLIGYNFITLRSVGDQPGQGHPHYLSAWRTLPSGVFVDIKKFSTPFQPPGFPYTIETNSPAPDGWNIYGFATSTDIPFPLATTPKHTDPNNPYVKLPYLAFDYQGRLISDRDSAGNFRDAFIPLAQGSVLPLLDPGTKAPVLVNGGSPSVLENPPNNSTEAYNIIHVDWLTGRGRLEHPEVR